MPTTATKTPVKTPKRYVYLKDAAYIYEMLKKKAEEADAADIEGYLGFMKTLPGDTVIGEYK